MNLVFDGKKASDFDIVCANGTGNNSLYGETFVASKSINEDTDTQREKPYFRSVTNSPITLNLVLGQVDSNAPKLTPEALQLIKQWINKDEYCEFYFEEYPIRHYFGIMTADSTLNHNGLGEGYINVQIRCDAPYAYSPVMSDYINVPSEGIKYELWNKGDRIMIPDVEFTKIGNGSLSILNQTDRGNQTTIANLLDGETIQMSGEQEILLSSLDNVYHADDFNDKWLTCPIGRNRLFINGQCKLKLYWRYLYD